MPPFFGPEPVEKVGFAILGQTAAGPHHSITTCRAQTKRGRDTAVEIMVITTFGLAPRYFLLPMIEFKQIARTYGYPERNHFSWEISGSRIKNGALDAFEIKP
ncbi:hypothetical protein ACVDG5_034010 [Mesorhizobium sp. ORM6]